MVVLRHLFNTEKAQVRHRPRRREEAQCPEGSDDF
jgi:hypothetical protein